MPNASFVTTNFAGGEISQTAQGRFDLPSYRISLNVCFNSLPLETGAWVRRPGTQHVAPMRGGAHGRVISFAFEENFPYNMLFTDGFLRFTTGPALVMTNDQQPIIAISTANPAVVQTAGAHGWTTGNAVMFNSLGTNDAPLQNRQFTITVVDSTHFSIADGITGTSIDGSTLGSFVSGNVTRILELATIYTSGLWSSLRSVQAETRTVLLNGTNQPQVLQVATQPTPTQFATFTLSAASFIDGPYLDPIPNSQITPSGGLNGVITLTLSFAAWVSTQAYNVGDFVSSGGQGYQSLTALNQGNSPATSPSNWKAVNAGAAVNNGLGFISSDIGRLIRLFSEPQLWSATQSYSIGNIVAYSDGNGGFNYWTATGTIAAGVQPGTSTLWALNATAAQWTWAQIVSVTGSGLITPQTAIGSLTNSATAFDGNTTKNLASGAFFLTGIGTFPSWSAVNWSSGAICQYNSVAYQARINVVASSSYPTWNAGIAYGVGSNVQQAGVTYVANHPSGGNNPFTPIQPGSPQDQALGTWSVTGSINTQPPPAAPGLWASLGPLANPVEDVYVGQHYASGIAIQSGTLFPSSDLGVANTFPITVNLRASNSAPTSPSNGTLLGTTGSIGNTVSPVTVTSSNQSSTWTYVWFEIVAAYIQPLPDNGSHIFEAGIGVAQAEFFSPNIANGSVVTAQILGGALLYNQTVRRWRLGVYSNTTGWPTCGTYHEGRIWFGGVVSNRFDAGVSNGINGTLLNFSPTQASGQVTDANAISYTCDGPSVNQLLWMEPDQQGILFGTQAGEWLISAPAQGALSPTNIKAVRVTKIGCANVEPRRAEHTLLVVHKFARKVVEYFADVFSGKFTAPNLHERAKHLTISGIAEIAYQQELAPVFWCRRNDGGLVGATYKRDTLTTSQGPTIIGHHRHTLGSGRLVESISVGPSQNGNLDALSMVTNDPNTGIRHIEMMTDLLDENFALTQCWFLDDAIVPTSTVIQAAPTGGVYGSLLVNGLSVHNGKTVTAYIAGLDCGDYTVSGGSITVPFGDGIAPNGAGTAGGLFTAALVQSFPTLPAVIGFTYNSDGQLVRPVTPADTGARSGPGWAKFTRQHRVGAQLFGMVNGSISFGTDFTTLYAAKLLQPNGIAYQINQQWSGIWRDNQNSPYGFDSNMTTWRISRPNPGFVMVVGGFDSTADA